MRNNIVVIGLSSFGFYLCQYLAEAGISVMAIDNNEAKIEHVKSFVKKAIVADAKNKEMLKSLQLNDFDAVVISVGEQIDTSVLITLYLRELGIKEIIAKAVTLDHAKVLNIIGADTIIFPERDVAKRFAHTLRRETLFDYIALDDKHSVIEIAPPQQWLGKTLENINIRKKYDVQIIMIKEIIPNNAIIIPKSDHIVKESDVLIILGKNEDLKVIEDME